MGPCPFKTALLGQWSLGTVFIQAASRGLGRLSIQAPHAFPLLVSLISLLVRSFLLWPKVVVFWHASEAHHGPQDASMGPSHCKFHLDASRWPEEVVVPSHFIVESCALVLGAVLVPIVTSPSNFVLLLFPATSSTHTPFISSFQNSSSPSKTYLQ